MKKQKTYSNQYKLKVVLEALQEDQSISAIASKYQITPKNIHNWKKHFLANASEIFSPSKLASSYKAKLSTLELENDELAKKLGKTTIERDWLSKKLNSSVSRKDKYKLVEAGLKISKKRQCQLLEINRSSVYYKPAPINPLDIEITHRIDEIYTDISPCYGYRNMHQQLIADGYRIGINKVNKLMRIAGIQAIYPHKKCNTSAQDNEHKNYPYLLKEFANDNKQIVATEPNHIWSGDITYIRMNGGFMYLAAIIDWYSKYILAWKVSNTMDSKLAADVLEQALAKYGAPQIFNSDQGSQYTSRAHIDILADNNIRISMNGKGRSIDNIAIERFFRSLKYENIYLHNYASVSQLKQGVTEYMYFYNNNRFHSALKYKKPMEVYMQLAA